MKTVETIATVTADGILSARVIHDIPAGEKGLSAEAPIDRLIEEVRAFRGNASQADDMTCVVVRVEEAAGGKGAITIKRET